MNEEKQNRAKETCKQLSVRVICSAACLLGSASAVPNASSASCLTCTSGRFQYRHRLLLFFLGASHTMIYTAHDAVLVMTVMRSMTAVKSAPMSAKSAGERSCHKFLCVLSRRIV